MNGIDMTELLVYLGEHLGLVAMAVTAAVAIALPAAVLLTRHSRSRRIGLAGAAVVQTIPSLALFGFLLPLMGVGKGTAVVALVLYGLLPILRNTVTGIFAVDPAVRESAVAMGMTDRELLFQVELPLAAPYILTGIRIAVVTTIGTATIAAAIGGGGLGVFIFRGIAMVDTTQILAGAVPAAAMAVVADEALEWLERRLSRA